MFLRARWYAPGVGRFTRRDPVEGEPPYLYAGGNPVNQVDPSGAIPQRPRSEADRARAAIRELHRYGVIVREDFGWQKFPVPPHVDAAGNAVGEQWVCGGWAEGNWKSAWELEQIQAGVEAMGNAMGGANQFARKVGRTVVKRQPMEQTGRILGITGWNITFYDLAFYESDRRKTVIDVRNTVVHEFAHAWDTHHGWQFSGLMMRVTGSKKPFFGEYEPGRQPTGIVNSRGEKAYPYNAREDWAESVAYVLFPIEYYLKLGLTRRMFVRNAFAARGSAELWRIYGYPY